MTDYKIRERVIRSRNPNHRAASDEVQVVLGRRVIGRHDTREQAERHIQQLKLEAAAKVKA